MMYLLHDTLLIASHMDVNSYYYNLYHFAETDDNDHTCSTVTTAILVVLLVVSLICCFGLIITVFKLYKKVIFLQEKIK